MYSKYLSDSKTESVLSDQAFIQQFLLYERMLARVQSDLGMISQEAAQEIQEVLSTIQIDPATLADSFLANGIPSIEILRRCREQLSKETRAQLHLGMTSQDVIDTAHILMYRNATIIIQERILQLLKLAAIAASKHRTTYAMARTRTQQAGVITYGMRIALWMNPVISLYEQFGEIAESCFKLQLAGAYGTNVAFGEHARQVAEKLADTLGLSYQGNWHTNRLGIKMLSDWLTSITGVLGKVAKDILFLSATEVGEIKENKHGGGKSSAMPHKSNPILSEAILAMAMENNIEALKINQAQLHAGERDAASWILEWKAMKTLLLNTAASLNHLILIMEHFDLFPDNISRNLNMIEGMALEAGQAFDITDSFIETVHHLQDIS